MTLAMAGFAVGDALVKLASGGLSVAQILLIMSVIGITIYIPLAWRAGDRVIDRGALSPPILARCGIEALTAITMVSALATAPLSLVVSIIQAVPLLVTVGAAVVLRERVGPRRWAAVGVGLIGVLMMLRPDTGGGMTGALLALLAALGLASRDIVTRIAPKSATNLQMATWGMASMIPAGLILLPITGPQPALGGPTLSFALLAALVNAVGYFAITAAMRVGEVSAVTPFRYTRLLFSLFIAVIFLAERPDALTLFGAALVIGSGLFVLWRERRLMRAS